MIIYTHEDVLKMMNTFHTSELNRDLCMAKLTPIQLPQQETLYTEEQVNQKMIDFAQWCRTNNKLNDENLLIEQLFSEYKSIKQ
jgi:hypothetical protein